jgi:competence ComEA-like helix-hairpin-helix protein
MHRDFVPDPQPLEGSRAGELADRFNPNTATQAELAAIPGVGEKLAGAIVAYRVEYAKLHRGQPAFAEPRDLLAVKGIGVAKMEGMEAYLVFPATAGTRPASRP